MICAIGNIELIRETLGSDRGQTLVEYTLILSLVVLLAITPLSQIGVWVWNWLEPVGNAL